MNCTRSSMESRGTALIHGTLTALTMLACVAPLHAADPVYSQTFHSRALDLDMQYDIILPDQYTNGRAFPVLYLLPGRNMHYDTWRYNSTLLTNMTGRRMIVVIPDTENTWYMGAWATYIARDLMAHIESRWHAQNVRGIAGISMGGYGAFYIAGRSVPLGGKPYQSLSAMSGAFVDPWVSMTLDQETILDIPDLAKPLGTQPPAILFDCGDSDKFDLVVGDYSLAHRNDLMRDALIARGRTLWRNLEYARPPGDHDWDYWNSRIDTHLAFHDAEFARYPYIAITSLPPLVTTVVTSDVVRVAGIAYAVPGIARVNWATKGKSVLYSGIAEGTNEWHADVSNQIGKNVVTITAWASGGSNMCASINLFRRNLQFRVRSIAVSKKQVTVKTSDITHGDIDALTNGMAGTGLFTLDGFERPLTNAWVRHGKTMARYSEKTTNWVVSIVINGDATRDTAVFSFKPRKGQMPTNFFDVVRTTNSIPFEIAIGAYSDATNLMLNAKGKFSSTAPWF